MDLKYLVNGMANRFSELLQMRRTAEHDSRADDFFENLITSVMIACIKDFINSINCVLDERGKSSFKLLYSPSVVNLLSVLSVFRGAEKGSFGKVSCDLSDKRLLTEDVGSLIGCLLIERCHLLDRVDEKVTFLKECNYRKLFVSRLTTSNESMLSGEHEGVTDLQTKMMVVQVLFDL